MTTRVNNSIDTGEISLHSLYSSSLQLIHFIQMASKNSKKTAANEAAPMTANTTRISGAAALPRPARRVIQNFLLIWLDANFDESKPDFRKSLQQLRHIVASITTFKDADECIDFLDECETENVFMIISGSLGRYVVPCIEEMPQLRSIYVFYDNKAIHEEWLGKIPKVKGAYTDIESICQALQIDCEHCDRTMISITFSGTDALFMYTQLLKEAVLQIEDDDKKSLKELGDYCRLQNDIPEDQIVKIETEYRSHTPIWWYTAPYFVYSMLNRGLRIMDTDIIMKLGFFMRHLQNHMAKLYREQQSKNPIQQHLQFIVGKVCPMKTLKK